MRDRRRARGRTDRVPAPDVVVVGAGIVGAATARELTVRGAHVLLVDRGEVSSGTTGLGEGNVLACDKPVGPELALTLAGLRAYDEIERRLGPEARIRRKGALVVHPDAATWAAEPERVARLQAAGVEAELLDAGRVRRLEPRLTGDLHGASRFPGDLQCDPRAIALALAREAAEGGGDVRTGCAVEAIELRGARVAGVRTAGGTVAAGAVVIAAGAWSAELAATAGLALPVEPRWGQLVRLATRDQPPAADDAPSGASARTRGDRSGDAAGGRGDRSGDAAGGRGDRSGDAAGGRGDRPRDAAGGRGDRSGAVTEGRGDPAWIRHKVIDGSYLGSVLSADAGLQVTTVLETAWDGHVLVGSSRARRGFDTAVDPAVSEAMLSRAARLMPGLAELRVDAAWAGLRPWLPDNLPAIGPSRSVPGLWVATGHEGAGVALGPVTGRLLAEALCGEPPQLDLAPFDPDRFAARRPPNGRS
jgi:glycine/D-amino acid oxidase-like deaminating enzyme